MAYILQEIDVNLDDFDTDEIVDEIIHRLNSIRTRSSSDEKQKIKLISIVEELYEELGLMEKNIIEDEIEINSLDDQYKYNHIKKVWDKYSVHDIETKLPE